MKEWYAVHARPRQEAVAELNLKRQGYRTYLPRILLRKRRRGKWARVVEPLFPRVGHHGHEDHDEDQQSDR